MTAHAQPTAPRAGEEPEIVETHETTCCVVGAGPGGAVLALLLARRGVRVTLLEAHADFERDFRGDTIHPSVMELLDDLGLAERLLKFRHSKIHTFNFATAEGSVTVADFRRLRTKFPFITMLPQSDFLRFVTDEAKRFPHFQLRMEARVEELIEEGGAVRGVRYRAGDGRHEIRAALTVGADGRSSRVRHLTGMEPLKTSPPMDVLWFRMPRLESDPDGAIGRFGSGHIVVMLDRLDQWQCGYVMLKGTYGEVRAAGLDALKESIAAVVPEYAGRLAHLASWKQFSMLSVESSRMPKWYQPGLLLIGDAAHVMSPVGGLGINYAIQDAVAAANILAAPLLAGDVREEHLRAVQQRREWPTRVIQRVQRFLQDQIIAGALDPTQAARLPLALRLLLRVPLLRTIPARLIGYGVRREKMAVRG